MFRRINRPAGIGLIFGKTFASGISYFSSLDIANVGATPGSELWEIGCSGFYISKSQNSAHRFSF